MRLPALLTRAAVLAAAVLLTPVSAVAGSAATPAPAPAAGPAVASDSLGLAPGMLDALRRDLGLTTAQVRTRLAMEAAAPVTERRLRAELGAVFGGAWLPAGAGPLVVAVTDPAAAGTVRAAGAVPTLVRHTERRLAAVRAALDAVPAPPDIHSWYVDVTTNTVVVSAAPHATAAVERFVASAGVDRTTVRTATSTGTPRTLYDVRGGDQYLINGNTLCSVGFSVQGGFVTAGHCGGVGSNTAGYNNVAQGTVRGSSFPGNDYGWVQTNGSWTPQPWVNNYAGGNVTVAGSAEAAIGSSVCRSGRTTGWRCGTILGKNETVNYAQGPVHGMTRSNACAEGGDSGGAWITGNQAQGVTSGGSGNCSTGATMWFQPVNEILGAYGLSLVTTGGGGTSRIVGYGGRCIDVPHSNPADGTQLWIWDCNGTAAQAWTFTGGTVQALGKCMDVAWGSRDNGAIIQIVGCSGNPAQQFVLSAAGDLVNPQSNKCVDVAGWNTANGAVLIQWECHGGANQKWYRN
jgi:streptogrisin C